MKNVHRIKGELFITSYKSPNMNGYYLLNDNVVCKKDETYFATSWKEREIIMTTDTDLIKDGVQAIDDEFLEWFVKNPSCEEVEVEELLYKYVSDYQGNRLGFYKIIIPKEESKKESKKETLEKNAQWVVLNRYAKNEFEKVSDHEMYHAIIEKVSKWQQEQTYSDKEVLRIIQKCKEYLAFGDEFDEIKWFEQFKKK